MALPLFAITLFVSAFLLFLVQPMIGKMILPKLGGTPQVWNTCMVFFQTVLLVGYAYTHTVSTSSSRASRSLLHGRPAAACRSCVLLPSRRRSTSAELDAAARRQPDPGARCWLLAIVVGLPFFVVSTSAPLLQKWFASTGHPAAKDPYFLYGASNLGSMLALLAYPFLVEPYFRLNPFDPTRWEPPRASTSMPSPGCGPRAICCRSPDSGLRRHGLLRRPVPR